MLAVIATIVLLPTIFSAMYVVKLFIWDALIMGIVEGLTE